jgi:hypothetical protein
LVHFPITLYLTRVLFDVLSLGKKQSALGVSTVQREAGTLSGSEGTAAEQKTHDR